VKGRKGEREKGRKGEREKGRMGEWEKVNLFLSVNILTIIDGNRCLSN